MLALERQDPAELEQSLPCHFVKYALNIETQRGPAAILYLPFGHLGIGRVCFHAV